MNITPYINNGIKDFWSLLIKKGSGLYVGVVYS